MTTIARTVTFGDVAENRPGMQHIGSMADHGLSLEELTHAKDRFEASGCFCELINLCDPELIGFDVNKCHYDSPIPMETAKLLVVRGGVSKLAET